MTQVIEAKPKLVTAEMRRAVPDAGYSCAGGCNTVYPADMLGYIEGEDAWVCAECAGEDDVFWLGFHWDKNDEPAYSVAPWAELPAPADKLPDPRYACAWGDCGADRTFPASELRFVEFSHGAPLDGIPAAGFHCPQHFRQRYKLYQWHWAYHPTLAEIFEALADLERVE